MQKKLNNIAKDTSFFLKRSVSTFAQTPQSTPTAKTEGHGEDTGARQRPRGAAPIANPNIRKAEIHPPHGTASQRRDLHLCTRADRHPSGMHRAPL